MALGSTLVLACGAGVATAGGSLFDVPAPYETGSRPIDIAIGKLNGDARKDIAVANRDSRTVSVLLGEPGGDFADAQNLETGGPQPQGVAIGDLNGDGRPDVVAAGDGVKDSVLVFRGRPGGFGPPVSYPVPGTKALSHVALADLDRDGQMDVAVSDSDQVDRYSVYVLYGKRGRLTKAKRLRLESGEFMGRSPESIEIADIDRDGIRDIAVTAFRGPSIWVLWGRGTRANPARRFAVRHYETGQFPIGLAVGDLDGDKRPDLVAANDSTGGTTVSVLYAKNRRGFKPFVTYPAGSQPQAVTIGDFDGDGLRDLATAAFDDNEVAVLRGEPGGFAAPEGFAFQVDVIDVEAAQLDRKGGADLVTALFNIGRINVLLTGD